MVEYEKLLLSSESFDESEISDGVIMLNCRLCEDLLNIDYLIELYEEIFICHSCVECVNSIS